MHLPVEYLAEKYKDHIFAASFNICRNRQDAEDITQETFFKYLKSGKEFQDEEHIKAWLLRVAINQSKDMLRSFWNRNRVSMEEYVKELDFEEPGDDDVMLAILKLPRKLRITIHLFYYEEYSVQKISEILETGESTVRTRLTRARRLLKAQLQEVWNENE